jgi:hypothetical protein
MDVLSSKKIMIAGETLEYWLETKTGKASAVKHAETRNAELSSTPARSLKQYRPS